MLYVGLALSLQDDLFTVEEALLAAEEQEDAVPLHKGMLVFCQIWPLQVRFWGPFCGKLAFSQTKSLQVELPREPTPERVRS